MITDRWPGVDPSKYDWDGFVGFIVYDADAGYRIAKSLSAAGKKNLVAINGVQAPRWRRDATLASRTR